MPVKPFVIVSEERVLSLFRNTESLLWNMSRYSMDTSFNGWLVVGTRPIVRIWNLGLWGVPSVGGSF